MVLEIEKSCPTSITTSSGTFNFYEEKAEKCQAEEICKSKGQILAPITNMEDRRAIEKIGSQECGIFRMFLETYHIGLEIKKCGNKVTKIFSNGVAYNKTLHDRFYHFYPAKGYDHCLTALWSPKHGPEARIAVVGKFKKCKDYVRRFVCLDPANSTVNEDALHLKRSKRSEKLSTDNVSLGQENFYTMSQMFGLCFFACLCCFLFVVNKAQKERIKFLEMKTQSLTK